MRARVTLAWALLGLLVAAGGSATEEAPRGLPLAVYADVGVWPEGLAAIEAYLDARGIAWHEVDADALAGEGLAAAYSAVWVPGGWAPDYLLRLSPLALGRLREFVASGGAYIGTCAGAYLAAATVRWDGVDIPYPLALYSGRAEGPAFDSWEHPHLETLAADGRHPLNCESAVVDGPVLLYGGGRFVDRPTVVRPYASVVARFAADGSPVITTTAFGHGRVLLMGVHAEMSSRSELLAVLVRWAMGGGFGRCAREASVRPLQELQGRRHWEAASTGRTP